nr:MAG TPA: hypothetical protein [Caudoviricetes sp.]
MDCPRAKIGDATCAWISACCYNAAAYTCCADGS